ncbi:hypothetical protein, partial [Ellagibacter isourolithinifaciens]|uniref:hypothetical protein n=1 Tax=Ellagibacter isourolithinifaciens TaxID=2137581 RepID=UPI003FD8AF28
LALSAPEATKTMMEHDWGITDREGLIRQLYSLLRAGQREGSARAATGAAGAPEARLPQTTRAILQAHLPSRGQSRHNCRYEVASPH